jgi:hypothetical protein
MAMGMKRAFHCLLFTISPLILLLSVSCEKDEGLGGSSSVSGRVLVRQYNANFTVLTEEYYATDEDVFIIYGNDQVYGDKTSTHYDGTFRFDYLREGNYTIYAYSEDSANYPSQHEIPVMIQVSISGKNKDMVLNDLVILK